MLFHSLGEFCILRERLTSKQICKLIHPQQSKVVACINPYSFWMSLSDKIFHQSLANSILICDGKWLAWAMRIRSKQVFCNTGSDLFEVVCENAKVLKCNRMFFIGGTEDSLGDLIQKSAKKYPEIEIVGFFSPPFKEEFDGQIVIDLGEQITTSEADVVWIGLGAPKQEKFAMSLSQYCSPTLIGCVGAVFDFQSGRISRAPWFIRQIGFEWLHRLVSDPGRIWPRIVPSLLVVLAVILGIMR